MTSSGYKTSRRRLARRQGGVGISLSAAVLLAVAACLGRGAKAVSNGGKHSCSVFDDGSVKCWGANGSGQLGVGDLYSRGALPSDMGDDLPEVDLGTDFVASGVSCGLDHSCAWNVGGKVKCWGGNAYGQLGLEDTANRGGRALTMGDNLPFLDLGLGETVQEVVAANHFTCVLLIDETVKCFGRNDWGQLGSGNKANNLGDATGEMGDELPRVQLVPDGANATVSVLAAHNGPCVIMQSDVASSVAVKCWGPNGYGSLGVGDAYNRGDDPNEMGGNLGAAYLGTNVIPIDLVTGMDYVCALTSAGGVKCWGRNCNGQGGFGDIETYGDDPDEMGDNLPFVDLGTGRTAVSLTAGDAHTCAVLDDGTVKCWGKGYFGQTGLERWHSVGQTAGQMGDDLPTLDLGTSSAPASGRRALRGLQAAAAATPVAVESISAGGQRSCAILDGGSVKCWGNAFAGALGLGDETDRGGRVGQMGDSLPMLSLGAGKVAVTPTPAVEQTPSPTLAPTPAPVPATPKPTSLAEVQVPATPAPTLAPTPHPTPTPTPDPTPAPTLAPTVAERGGFEGLMDDFGVSVTQGIAIAAGVPLIALLACCFCGFCIARKKKDKKQKEELESEVIAAVGRKGSDGRAATIAPASAVGSRIGSRSNSRAGSRIGSRQEEMRADALLADILADKGVNIFFSEGIKDGAKPSHAPTGSVENDGSWFAASRRPVAHEEEGADDSEKRLSSANIGQLLGSATGKGDGFKQVTPNIKHTASSSETPPNMWGDYEAQPIDASGSFTPESNAGGGVHSRGHSRNASATHSRSASDARPSTVVETEVSTAAVHADPQGAPAPPA